MNSRVVRIFAVVLAMALFAVACGGGSDGGDDAATGTDSSQDNVSTGDQGADDGGSGDSSDVDAVQDSTDTVELIEEDTSEDPVSGGTLRYGLEADVDGLNPASSALPAAGAVMALAVFDTYAAWDADDNWVPFLAESFTPNDDFTQWTMKLREGIEFHDGTPLNSAAVVVNFETQFGDPLVGLAVRPFYVAENPIEVIDDLTVQYNLAFPNANWPSGTISQLGMVASPTWLAAADADPTLNQRPVGTGPFVFDSRSEDSVTRFVRNDNWWNGAAYLDAVEFVPVTDSGVRTDLLVQGELEALQTTNQESVIELQAEERLQNILDDSGEESFVMMNSASPPFDDVRARQALTLLTPRQDYILLIGLGVSQEADQMFTPSSPYFVDSIQQEGDEPDAAMPLIESYCADNPDECSDGRIDMEFQWSGPSVVQTRIAELFDESWSPGFNVSFQELFQDAHIQEVAFGQYDAVTWRGFGAVNPADDSVWLSCATIGGISINWPRFCDEDRDVILAELALATTVDEREPLLADLSQNVQDAYTYVFLTHTLWVNSFDEDVRGVCGHASPEGVPLRCAINGRTWLSNVWMAE